MFEVSSTFRHRAAFVVVANHTSNLDPRPLGIALWPRALHFMAKHEAWKPPLKWLIAAVGWIRRRALTPSRGRLPRLP